MTSVRPPFWRPKASRLRSRSYAPHAPFPLILSSGAFLSGGQMNAVEAPLSRALSPIVSGQVTSVQAMYRVYSRAGRERCTMGKSPYLYP